MVGKLASLTRHRENHRTGNLWTLEKPQNRLSEHSSSVDAESNQGDSDVADARRDGDGCQRDVRLQGRQTQLSTVRGPTFPDRGSRKNRTTNDDSYFQTSARQSTRNLLQSLGPIRTRCRNAETVAVSDGGARGRSQTVTDGEERRAKWTIPNKRRLAQQKLRTS